MIITAPATSTPLTDVLTKAQLETINAVLAKRQAELRIEAHSGTLWWTTLGTAVVDECNSILDGDIEIVKMEAIDEMEVIAGSGVTFNLGVV